MSESTKQKLFNSHTFLVMVLLLIIFETIHIVIGYWSGDFWQHAAVVNELSKDLLHPRNPMIDANIPHAFYSPYSLLVGKFAQLTNVGPINALAFFAFFNLVFFLWSFYYFCRSVFHEKADAVATISLILILFLTGIPLSWSGFFHFYFFHKGLPYPSTFAFALSLYVLGKLIRMGDNRNRSKIVLVILLAVIVFITHPNTGLFLFVSIIALNFTFFNFKFREAIFRSVIVIIPCLLLSALWPYYNMVNLLFGKSADFHSDSKVLYNQIPEIAWPVVLIMPAIALTRYNNIVRFFISAIILMIAIYTAGYFFKIYGVGRLLSSIIVLSDFLIAYTLFMFWKERKNLFRTYGGLIVFALVLSLSLNLKLLKRTIGFSEKNTSYYTKFNALKTIVKENETILSDIKASLFIPSVQGKVIAVNYPLYWVNDIDERRKNIDLFFKNGTADSSRIAILNKYHPHYILIDYKSIPHSNKDIDFYRSLGTVVHKKDDLELIRLTY